MTSSNVKRHALVGHLEVPSEGDKKKRRMELVYVYEKTTLEEVKNQLESGLEAKNIRLFLERTGEEISNDKDIHKYDGDMVVIVTADNKPLLSSHVVLPLPKGPPGIPFLGNSMDLLPNLKEGCLRLFNEYGPVFPFTLPLIGGEDLIFLADPDLVEKVMTNTDDWGKLHMKRFPLRKFVGPGLFTADDDEEIWGLAHRILLPAFSNQGMRKYFDIIISCIEELMAAFDTILKEPLDINEWCARFTFEVICRVTFGHEFGSFSEKRPRFLQDLDISSVPRTLPFYKRWINRKVIQDAAEAAERMNVFISDAIKQKKLELSTSEEAKSKKDLMTYMLCAKDPLTGKGLPDDNIRSQVMTFLVAGHDSTSTALTTLLYQLSSNATVEAKVIKEINEVVKDGPITWDHLAKLTYCNQAIKENLRLFPPAGAIRKTAIKDTQLGPYFVNAGKEAYISIWALHNNPKAWPNPTVFDPDRFSSENANFFKYAWLPFSDGPRACIGQQLSVIEQRLFLAVMVRKYSFRIHPTAHIHVTFPLFAKPNGVIMQIEKRIDYAPISAPHADSESKEKFPIPPSLSTLGQVSGHHKLLILYGSNMETCKLFAIQLENQAKGFNFEVNLVSLNDFVNNKLKDLPDKNGAVIIISSTYNGEPPDNAVQFKHWLTHGSQQEHDLLKGVRYTVFGVGNSQWKTFQVFPILIDQSLERFGAERFFDLGKGDVDGPLDDTFREWKAIMWFQLHETLELTRPEKMHQLEYKPIPFKILAKNAEDTEKLKTIFFTEMGRRNNAFPTKILVNKNLLGSNAERMVRHIEIELPKGCTYEAGDHLAVLPRNDDRIIQDVIQTLGLNLDDVVLLEGDHTKVNTDNLLPFGIPISLKLLLSRCAEFQTIATRSQIAYLASKTECPPEQKKLQALSKQASEQNKPSDPVSYEEYVLKPKRTLIELLKEFKSVKLDIGEFLALVPPMRWRYYSISSSSKLFPNAAHITVGVVNGTSPTGRHHMGVASTYLSTLSPDSPIVVFVKDTKSKFRLPSDISRSIIMIGPGTGVAPMRGFIQERKATNAKGKTVLFYGCRNDDDFIYKEELEQHTAEGSLNKLVVAYSRKQVQKTYVQHKLIEHGAEIFEMLEKGANIYVCGDAKSMAPDVRKAFEEILSSYGNLNASMAKDYVASLVHNERFFEDVWAT